MLFQLPAWPLASSLVSTLWCGHSSVEAPAQASPPTPHPDH